jgi:hypothetical protein
MKQDRNRRREKWNPICRMVTSSGLISLEARQCGRSVTLTILLYLVPGVQNQCRLASSCTKNKNPYHLFYVSPLSLGSCINFTVQHLVTGWKVRCSNSNWGKFLFSRTIRMSLRISKPPLQWLPTFFPGGKVAGRNVYHSLHLVPILRTSGAVPPLLLYAFMAWTGTTWHLPFHSRTLYRLSWNFKVFLGAGIELYDDTAIAVFPAICPADLWLCGRLRLWEESVTEFRPGDCWETAMTASSVGCCGHFFMVFLSNLHVVSKQQSARLPASVETIGQTGETLSFRTRLPDWVRFHQRLAAMAHVTSLSIQRSHWPHLNAFVAKLP